MLAFLRLVLTFCAILAIFYNALALYVRLRYHAALKQRWRELGASGDPGTFLREGMKRYDRSIRRKLIHLVYVLPPSVILLIVYVINFM